MKSKNNLVSQILRFLIVGGTAFVIDYVTLYIFTEFFNINFLISTALAFIISVIFNYIASIFWVFNVDVNKNSKQTFVIFIFLSIVGLLITEVIMWFGVNVININYLLVKIFATGIVMIFNFITRKLFLE